MDEYLGALVRKEQKTAYEILSGLVGSEMCIRDSSAPFVQVLLNIRPLPVDSRLHVTGPIPSLLSTDHTATTAHTSND